MEHNSLLVTYQETFGNFIFSSRLLAEFQRRIPLRHLQWKNVLSNLGASSNSSSATGSLTTSSVLGGGVSTSISGNSNPVLSSNHRSNSWKGIDQLPLEFIPFEEYEKLLQKLNLNSANTSNNNGNSLNSPLELFGRANPILHLIVIMSEDLEQYKTNVRQGVKDRIAFLSSNPWARSRKGISQEYLVVHVTNQEPVKSGLNLLRTSVYDKIKVDFRDRCCQIRLDDINDVEMWHELLRRMSEAILTSFVVFVLQAEEEVKKIEGDQRIRTSVGGSNINPFNFCSYLLGREVIAISHSIMNMNEDALGIYEELNILYHLLLDDYTKQKSNFQIPPSFCIDWLSLVVLNREGGVKVKVNVLDIAGERTRFRSTFKESNGFCSSSSSIVDFEVYLFMNKVFILLKMGRLGRVIYECLNFLQFMTNLIRREGSISRKERAAWIYSVAVQTFVQLNQLLSERREIDEDHRRYVQKGLADILTIARRQLDLLGKEYGYFLPWLSNEHESMGMLSLGPEGIKSNSYCMLKEGGEEKFERSEMSLNDLETSIEKSLVDCRSFVDLYLNVSELVIKRYQSIGNCFRTIWSFMNDVATLQLLCQDYENAIPSMQALLSVYEEQRWTVLSFEISKKLVYAFEKIGKAQKVIESCLSLLNHQEMLEHEELGDFYMEILCDWSKRLEQRYECDLDKNPLVDGISLSSSASKINTVNNNTSNNANNNTSNSSILVVEEGKVRIDVSLNLSAASRMYFDKIQVNLVGSLGTDMLFESETAGDYFEHGINNVKSLFSANTGMVGDFVPEWIKIYINNFCLYQSFLQKKSSSSRQNIVKSTSVTSIKQKVTDHEDDDAIGLYVGPILLPRQTATANRLVDPTKKQVFRMSRATSGIYVSCVYPLNCWIIEGQNHHRSVRLVFTFNSNTSGNETFFLGNPNFSISYVTQDNTPIVAPGSATLINGGSAASIPAILLSGRKSISSSRGSISSPSGLFPSPTGEVFSFSALPSPLSPSAAPLSLGTAGGLYSSSQSSLVPGISASNNLKVTVEQNPMLLSSKENEEKSSSSKFSKRVAYEVPWTRDGAKKAVPLSSIKESNFLLGLEFPLPPTLLSHYSAASSFDPANQVFADLRLSYLDANGNQNIFVEKIPLLTDYPFLVTERCIFTREQQVLVQLKVTSSESNPYTLVLKKSNWQFSPPLPESSPLRAEPPGHINLPDEMILFPGQEISFTYRVYNCEEQSNNSNNNNNSLASLLPARVRFSQSYYRINTELGLYLEKRFYRHQFKRAGNEQDHETSVSNLSNLERGYLFTMLQEMIKGPLLTQLEYTKGDGLDFEAYNQNLISEGFWEKTIWTGGSGSGSSSINPSSSSSGTTSRPGAEIENAVMALWNDFMRELSFCSRKQIKASIGRYVEEKTCHYAFEIPPCKSLATVELIPQNNKSNKLIVGQMFNCFLQCKLNNSNVNGNGSNNNNSNSNNGVAIAALEFSYEIEADPNYWFLSGACTKRFKLSSGVGVGNATNFANDQMNSTNSTTSSSTFKSAIQLIPIRTGLIPMPMVKVTCLSDASCQTLCDSNGQLVLIHQDRHSARTYSIGRYFERKAAGVGRSREQPGSSTSTSSNNNKEQSNNKESNNNVSGVTNNSVVAVDYPAPMTPILARSLISTNSAVKVVPDDGKTNLAFI